MEQQYYYPYPYYQPPAAAAPPPPPPGTTHHVLPAAAYHQQADDVRTLFIAGLPEDVKAREIYNLFREFPGYQSSHLRTHTSLPFAFAVFADQNSALMALYELNGMVFDFEKGSKLCIELAKSNSRSKRLRTDDGRPTSEKRVKGSTAFSRDSDTARVNLMVEFCMKLMLKRQLIHVQHSLLRIWAKVVLSKSWFKYFQGVGVF